MNKLIEVHCMQAVNSMHEYFSEYRIGVFTYKLPVTFSQYQEMLLLEEDIPFSDSQTMRLLEICESNNHIISCLSIKVDYDILIGVMIVQDANKQCVSVEFPIQEVFIMAKILSKDSKKIKIYSNRSYTHHLAGEMGINMN